MPIVRLGLSLLVTIREEKLPFHLLNPLTQRLGRRLAGERGFTEIDERKGIPRGLVQQEVGGHGRMRCG